MATAINSAATSSPTSKETSKLANPTAASSAKFSLANASAEMIKAQSLLVVDEMASMEDVNQLIHRYRKLKPSQPSRGAAEDMSRKSIDQNLREQLSALKRDVGRGIVSKSDFQRIAQAVIQAKLEPSAATYLRAVLARELPSTKESLADGPTAAWRNQLLENIVDLGDFNHRAPLDPAVFAFDADKLTHTHLNGRQFYHHSNAHMAFSLMSTLDPGFVDETEMAEIDSALRGMLLRDGGRLSDSDINRLRIMRDVANERPGHDTVGIPERRRIDPVGIPERRRIDPLVSALPVFGNPKNLPVSALPWFTNPKNLPVSALPVFTNPTNPPVSALPVFTNPTNPPVSALPVFGNPAAQSPIAQAVQDVFAALMKQLRVDVPHVPGSPTPVAGSDLRTGDQVGPNVDWRQMFGNQPGSNFVVVPTVMANEARNRLALGYSNDDVAREIWTRFTMEWGDLAKSIPVTRFGDEPGGRVTLPDPTPPMWQPPLPPPSYPPRPQPPLPPAQERWAAVDNGDGTGHIDIGSHTIKLNEKSSEWLVTDKATGKQTRIWGDPHVDFGNDKKNDLDFKGNLNLMLGNTRVHIETVPYSKSKSGQTLTSRLTISDGKQTLQVSGLAQQVGGVNQDGKMKITRLEGAAAAQAYDKSWGDQVVYQGGDGAWYVAAGKLQQGSLKLGADGKERVDFSKVDGSQRLPQFGGSVGRGFTITDGDQQMKAALRMIMQQLTDLLQRFKGSPVLY
jgi:hypothetical protein